MKSMIYLSILIGISLQAKAFTDDCGTYSEKGVLRTKGSQFFFYINEKTAAQIEFKLGESKLLKPEMNGVAVQLKFKKAAHCDFNCVADVLDVEKVISPFENIPFKSPGQFKAIRAATCLK